MLKHEQVIYDVRMKLNKNHKKFEKNEAIWVQPQYFDNYGCCVFEVTRGDYSGVEVKDKHLEVLTREKDPEYFL